MTYSEYHIGERAIVAYRWITESVQNLLDAGCEDGNNASLLSKKSQHTWGIDINKKSIERAQRTYPSISFFYCPVETTPFNDNFFDVIVMNDVLEHVHDETIALNEIFRILKNKGQLIISTPHKGIFAFLDPANYKFLIKNRTMLQLIYGKKKTAKFLDTKINSGTGFHRHYTLTQLCSILDKSLFRGNYSIEHVFRSGLMLGILTVNLKVLLRRLVGERIAAFILFPLAKLASFEYWIPFGPLSYNIALSIKRQR